MQQCKHKRWKWTLLDGRGSDATAEVGAEAEALEADLFGWKQKWKRKQLKGTSSASTAKNCNIIEKSIEITQNISRFF